MREIEQQIINSEVIVSDEPSRAERDIRSLLALQGPIYAFGSHSNDEFYVDRESGERQGIFKTWAIPVIPFLEAGNLSLLEKIWEPVRGESESNGFALSLEKLVREGDTDAEKATVILDEWTEKCFDSPEKFKESLENARVVSFLTDRRLQEIFRTQELAKDPLERVSQLVHRLQIGFALEAPFYNLEALIGDPSGFRWNPVAIASERQPENRVGGGMLDVAALTLPSIFADSVTASQLDWHGLTWDKLEEESLAIRETHPEASKIIEIAKLTESPLSHVLFGLNVFEWIPSRVGGKTGDFSPQEAKQILENRDSGTSSTKEEEIIKIGQDMNGLIRFLNWFPLIASKNTMEKATEWRYASVCDTSSQLLQTLNDNPSLWREEFRDIFTQKLASQIESLDATSAKGRFLLQLILNEGTLGERFFNLFVKDRTKEDVIKEFLLKKEEESIMDLGGDMQPRMNIGGKAFGLQEALQNLGGEFTVPNGFIVTSECLSGLLFSDIQIEKDIITLDKTTDVEERLCIAQQIRDRIRGMVLSETMTNRIFKKTEDMGELFAVRSSSWDEDSIDGQTAAGIYESSLFVPRSDIPNAVIEVVNSFFSDKAVNFRAILGKSDLPHIAALIQPMIEGNGGVAFSHNVHGTDTQDIIIEVGSTIDGVTSGSLDFSRFDSSIQQENTDQIEDVILEKVRDLVQRFATLSGSGVDIEWVEKDGNIILLQQRSLPAIVEDSQQRTDEAFLDFRIDERDDLPALLESIKGLDGKARLIIEGKHDLDKFQGDLFKILALNGRKIGEIVLTEDIPMTSHFANICSSLGIRIMIQLDI